MDHISANSRSNMYTSRSGSGVAPPSIPPRESSIPTKGLKPAQPEVKKKKARRAESVKVKEQSENDLSLLLGGPGKRKDMIGSRESLSSTSSVPEMTLLEFVKCYSKQLPQRIKVINGFCGNSNRLTISANDQYNIHLLKHLRVARVKDMIGTEYSVPINSSIEFGLVFDPLEESSRPSQQALSGFNLRVTDIFSLPSLPKLLCCMSSWNSADHGVFLEENEVVVIRGVQKSRMKNKKTMKIFSIKKKIEMVVPDNCMVLFSTRPRLVRMTLSDIMEFVPDPFPRHATVYLGDELYHNPTTAALIQDMSDRFLSDVVKVSGIVTESSLIASALYPEGIPTVDDYGVEQVDEYVDIPLEGELLNIEVSPVATEETKIYDDTINIYEKFDPTKLKCMKEMSSTQASATQNLFYSAVKQGLEKHGVELDEPTVAYVSMSHPSSVQNKSSKKEGNGSDNDSDGYETIYHEIGEGNSARPVFSGSTGRSSKPHSAPSSGDGEVRRNKGDVQIPGFLAKKLKPSIPASTSAPPPPPPPPPHPPSDHTPPSSPQIQTRAPHPAPKTTQPNTFHNSSPAPFSSSPAQSQSQERLKKKMVLPPEGSTPSPLAELEKLSKMATLPSRRRTPESSDSKDMDSAIKKLEKRVSDVEASVKSLDKESRNELSEMKEQIRLLVQRMEDLKNFSYAEGSSRPSIAPSMVTSEEHSEEDAERNRKALSKLSLQQMLTILDHMELSKYKKTFQEEHLSGEIALELTDEIMKDELGVQSKIHRIRLMKLVSGTHPYTQYLTGQS